MLRCDLNSFMMSTFLLNVQILDDMVFIGRINDVLRRTLVAGSSGKVFGLVASGQWAAVSTGVVLKMGVQINLFVK